MDPSAPLGPKILTLNNHNFFTVIKNISFDKNFYFYFPVQSFMVKLFNRKLSRKNIACKYTGTSHDKNLFVGNVFKFEGNIFLCLNHTCHKV